MATIISRHPSVISYESDSAPPTPFAPLIRPRELSPSSSSEIEIIDVDELPDLDEPTYSLAAPSTSAGTSRATQGQRQNIQSQGQSQGQRPSTTEVITLDSDDEDYDPYILVGSSASTAGSSRVPPPSNSNEDIPRLRRDPAQFAPFPFPSPPSPPMRRNPPPFPTSNPSASSSSFSARRAADARTRASARLMAAAPANERRAGGSRFGLRRALAAPLAARPATRTFPHGPGDMHLVGLLRQHFFEPLNALDFGSGIDDFGFEPGFPGPYARRNEEEEDYLAEYTHPGKGKPPVGFSFDIDLSPPTRDSSVAAPSSPKTRKLPITSLENPIVLDDDGEIVEEPKAEGKVEELELKLASGSRPAASPSTVAQLTISVSLVCSKCLDPLLLGEGATAMASLTASTEVDVDRVQVPERERNARRYRIWGLRCGHLIDGKCLEALGYPPRALDAETKRKWKEKACDNDVAGAGNNDGEGKTQSEESASFSNSIRARLRSATSNTSSSESTVTAPPSLLHRIFGSRPQPKTVPKIQETYIWRCPVANCRREHVSVKMDDGVWRQGQGQGGKEEGEGAIALFI